jgi:hypothetical protein
MGLKQRQQITPAQELEIRIHKWVQQWRGR